LLIVSGCGEKNPVSGDNRTVIYSDGFENGLSGWQPVYQVTQEDLYKPMRINSTAKHSGNNSITSDSSMTALYHIELDRIETGTVGVEFYMMAQSLEKTNFGVEIGQNPGSSGAVSPAYGIYFDPSDSIKCTSYTSFPSVDIQKMVAPIQAGKWYKLNIDVNMANSTVTYSIDGTIVHTEKTSSLYGIDRLLVFRGKYGKDYSSSSDGVKPYFIDDITYYKK
jgi:hypothetical protein